MVIEIIPQVSGDLGQTACPICSFENVIHLEWKDYSALGQSVHGSKGYFSPNWDSSRTGFCSHLGKYIVEKNLMIFVEDWEQTAREMGASLFSFPHVDGVPEKYLLEELRAILEFRLSDPEGYKSWVSKKLRQ